MVVIKMRSFCKLVIMLFTVNGPLGVSLRCVSLCALSSERSADNKSTNE